MKATAVWRHRAAEIFGIDLRSLALFRAMLAAVTVFDLLRHLATVRAFFTDFGVLPHSVHGEVAETWRVSLHLANGETWFQLVLLVGQALLALLVLVGYRTRVTTVLTFLLLVSLQNRNPLILTGADN